MKILDIRVALRSKFKTVKSIRLCAGERIVLLKDLKWGILCLSLTRFGRQFCIFTKYGRFHLHYYRIAHYIREYKRLLLSINLIPYFDITAYESQTVGFYWFIWGIDFKRDFINSGSNFYLSSPRFEISFGFGEEPKKLKILIGFLRFAKEFTIWTFK